MKRITILLLLVISINCFVGCTSNEARIADALEKKDTVVVTVHDTVFVKSSDDDLVETIQYYKRQHLLLWEAIGVLQGKQDETTKNNKLEEINRKIVSEREAHNNKVNKDLVNALTKIAQRQ